MAFAPVPDVEMLLWGLVLLLAMFALQFDLLRRKERRAEGLPTGGFPILTWLAIAVVLLALGASRTR